MYSVFKSSAFYFVSISKQSSVAISPVWELNSPKNFIRCEAVNKTKRVGNRQIYFILIFFFRLDIPSVLLFIPLSILFLIDARIQNQKNTLLVGFPSCLDIPSVLLLIPPSILFWLMLEYRTKKYAFGWFYFPFGYSTIYFYLFRHTFSFCFE